MVKKLLLFSALIVVSFATFAGGLLTNTNQHITYLRYLARQSSTEIDAIYYNPAGTGFLKEGWSFSLNGQSAFQTRTIHSTFGNEKFPGFAGSVDNKGNYTKKFKGDASAPIIPSLFGAYKNGHWTFSGSFSVTGGGGKATFDDGLASFESNVALLPNLLSKDFPGTSKYRLDSYMEGSQIIYGLQMGAAYQINENWSVYGGVRMNYVSNEYYGYVRDISANIGGKEMVEVAPYMNSLAKEMLYTAGFLQAQGKLEEAEQYRQLSAKIEKTAERAGDQELDCTQSGWGVTPIIGLHFRSGKWDAGIKYEMNTKLNVENKTKHDTTGKFKHGVNTPNDIPSVLTVGATYRILPTLRASVGYNHFFDTHAKMADNKQDHIKQGTNEYLGGVEWDICRWAQVSGGLQRTKYGVTDNYQSDMSFAVSSMSYGFGAGFMLAENVKLNVAYFWTDYGKHTKNTDNYNGTNLPGMDVFSRTNKVFGVGLDFSF
ncbi:putative outer membrane protein [Bacteroides coprosuis DSM 18011]|uniref:Putative outer membrane protein n=1 Tax=Bacteroides coprosuis DSM 18011 TaxID=679937 RepID=F3ZTP8_9BACE|nr:MULTISPECIES: hypothetical protein [Bacteroides]EGJ71279.1 putative outer membrane protein [Bacteroides coprosuis DSM 18011]HJD93088.1 hypothetical protein [Bacteroides coprosuis]